MRFSNIILWLGVTYLTINLIDFSTGGKLSKGLQGDRFTISDFNNALKKDEIASVVVTPMFIKGTLKNGNEFKTDVIPYYTTNILEKLEGKDIPTNIVVDSRSSFSKIFSV